jgi:hypothetical protein
MTTIRTIPVHEIVERTYPRPAPTDQDEFAKAAGRAIDGALSQFGHEFREKRRPSATAMRTLGESLFDEAIEEAGVDVPAPEREKILTQLRGMLQAYRQSEIFGLARPKTRVIMIAGQVGVYAQPDYWDGRGRFFEMKSFKAIPPPPDVALQLRLFQLAYPRFEAVLICINRHVSPVETVSTVIAPLTQEDIASTLRLAFDVGQKFGEEKVLEYMEGPFTHYALPAALG